MNILKKIQYLFFDKEDKEVHKHVNRHYLSVFMLEFETEIKELKETLDFLVKSNNDEGWLDVASPEDMQSSWERIHAYKNEIIELQDVIEIIKRILNIYIDNEDTLKEIVSYLKTYKKNYSKIITSTILDQTDFGYFQKDGANENYVAMQDIKKILKKYFEY